MGKIRDALDRRQAIRDGVWQPLSYAKKAGGKKKKKKDEPNCKNSQECNVGGKRYCIPKGKTCGGKVRAPLDPRRVDDLRKMGGTFEGAIGGLKNGKKYQVSPEMLAVANKLGVSQLQLQSGRVPKAVQADLIKSFNQMTIGDSVTKPKSAPNPKKVEPTTVGGEVYALNAKQQKAFAESIKTATGISLDKLKQSEAWEQDPLVKLKLRRAAGLLPPPPSQARPPVRSPRLAPLSDEERIKTAKAVSDKLKEAIEKFPIRSETINAFAEQVTIKNLKQTYPNQEDLDIALRGISHMVSNYSVSFAVSAKPGSYPPPASMLEANLLNAYTKGLYAPMNEDLVKTPPEKMSDGQKAVAWMMEKALSSMPRSSEHVLFRGTSTSRANIDKYEVGQTISHGGALSTTENPDVINFFAPKLKSPDRATVSYRIVPKSNETRGALIDRISAIPTESEVLFPPGTPFRVAEKRETQPGFFEILLEEE